MLARLGQSQNERAFWFGIVAIVVTAWSNHLRPTIYDNYVRFADALLHGRLWLTSADSWIDAVTYNGHRYIVNDPVPGLLLVPFVKIFGPQLNQTVFDVVAGGFAAAFAWLLAERLEVPATARLLLCVFMYYGTDLWWCAAEGDVWFFAQTCASAFVLFALAELARARPRGWVVGTATALAAGSRFTLVCAVPVLVYLLARGSLGGTEIRPGGARRIGGFLVPLAVFFGLWVAYNMARWGVPWDSGHTIFFHQDRVGATTGSPFSLANLPMQISSFFFAPPLLGNVFPYVIPSLRGTALTWTSPALAFAFTARWPQRAVVAMWTAAVLVAVPSFLYFVNGYSQYGMRHALDFEPFLFVLMLFASYRRLPRWVWLTVGWSVLASTYGVWYWQSSLGPVHSR